MRLAGLMMIHENSPLGFEELVIGELARHVDALFIHANAGAPDSWVKATKSCPKLARFAEGRVPPGSQNEGPIVLRLLDDAKPEMFIYLDSDEIMPPNVEEIIDEMDKSGAMCVEFPILFCAGDPDHVITSAPSTAHDASTAFCGHGPHVKLAVWRPGLDRRTTVGCDYPGQDYVGRAWRSPWPIRHLVVARPRDWRRRYQTKPAPWMLDAWPVKPYDPTRKWT